MDKLPKEVLEKIICYDLDTWYCSLRVCHIFDELLHKNEDEKLSRYALKDILDRRTWYKSYYVLLMPNNRIIYHGKYKFRSAHGNEYVTFYKGVRHGYCKEQYRNVIIEKYYNYGVLEGPLSVRKNENEYKPASSSNYTCGTIELYHEGILMWHYSE